MDKALLDMPEDEIDPQRLPIKDLILLAEHRERMAVYLHLFKCFYLIGMTWPSLFFHFIVLVKVTSFKFAINYNYFLFEQIKDASKLKTPQANQRCPTSSAGSLFLLATCLNHFVVITGDMIV